MRASRASGLYSHWNCRVAHQPIGLTAAESLAVIEPALGTLRIRQAMRKIDLLVKRREKA